MTAGRVESAAFFGARAAWYDDAYDACSADGYALRSRLRAVVTIAGPGPGAALDAGMGPGRLCAALAARGWTVSGVDASADMVDAARRRLPEAAERLAVARIESVPFPDGCFDLVTASGVLEYADAGRALAEIARVLRPGGRAIVTYPNPRALYGIWKTRVFYSTLRAAKRLAGAPQSAMPRGGPPIAPDEFERLAEEAGLHVDQVRCVSYLLLPSPLDLVFPNTAAALGECLERRRLRPRALATQFVFAATT